MCSKKDPSCVRSPDKKKLLSFTFDKFDAKLFLKAPFLRAILCVSYCNRRNDSVFKQAVGMSAAICLRNHSKFRNGFHLLISIFGYHLNRMVSFYLFIILLHFLLYGRINNKHWSMLVCHTSRKVYWEAQIV